MRRRLDLILAVAASLFLGTSAHAGPIVVSLPAELTLRVHLAGAEEAPERAQMLERLIEFVAREIEQRRPIAEEELELGFEDQLAEGGIVRALVPTLAHGNQDITIAREIVLLVNSLLPDDALSQSRKGVTAASWASGARTRLDDGVVIAVYDLAPLLSAMFPGLSENRAGAHHLANDLAETAAVFVDPFVWMHNGGEDADTWVCGELLVVTATESTHLRLELLLARLARANGLSIEEACQRRLDAEDLCDHRRSVAVINGREIVDALGVGGERTEVWTDLIGAAMVVCDLYGWTDAGGDKGAMKVVGDSLFVEAEGTLRSTLGEFVADLALFLKVDPPSAPPSRRRERAFEFRQAQPQDLPGPGAADRTVELLRSKLSRRTLEAGDYPSLAYGPGFVVVRGTTTEREILWQAVTADLMSEPWTGTAPPPPY